MKEEFIAETKDDNVLLFPTLATLGVVTFPKNLVTIDVSRQASIEAIDYAVKNKQNLFMVCQKDIKKEYPQKEDLYDIGTVVEIKQFQRRSNDLYVMTCVGLYRARVKEVYTDIFLKAEIKRMPEKRISKGSKEEIDMLVKATKKAFIKYALEAKLNIQDLIYLIERENNAVNFFNLIMSLALFEYKFKQELLCESDIYVRLYRVLEELTKEIKYAQIENNIVRQIEEKIDKNQREYFLREKAKLINEELAGEKLENEEDVYRRKINKIKSIDKESKCKLLGEVDKMASMPDMSHESYVISNYLDTVLSLPWDSKTNDKIDLNVAQKTLDTDHYGLKKVKDRIIENLAVRVFKKDLKSQILCFVGPPGVGKTSLGKSIAKAMGRKFVRISLGGINDESEIRGHRKTYIGAMPGRIISGIIQSGSKNPVILLDEIDKLTSNLRGDPASAMLEVLDPEQNSVFTDHYIEVPFDLSDCLFITTANSTYTIPAPLLDRMEIIEISSYTANEKFYIAKDYLLKKQLKKHGLKSSQIKIKDSAIELLIRGYTKEAGVRSLERYLASLIRKGAKKIATGDAKSVTFTSSNIESYIGPIKYLDSKISRKDEVGLVNGLAWTSVGGEIMQIEVAVMPGKGNVKLTGNLGDVMKESAQTAISYVRSIANKYGINPDFYKNRDIHIHLPEGAVPKDGPSAGVSLVTAITSALSKKEVKAGVAMTGEISLRGRVLPIGGLKEKTIAAYKAGINHIFIPKENLRDLKELDKEVKDAVEFIPVENVEEILNSVLVLKEKETAMKSQDVKIKYKKSKGYSKNQIRV